MNVRCTRTLGMLVFSLCCSTVFADISISVNATSGVKPISPYIYGRNVDGIGSSSADITEEEQAAINKLNEAGFRFLRANYGNNASKYNWRKKLTSHPDWYNNVYAVDWDITAKKLQDNVPAADVMYAFQLTGHVASSTEYNFADWDYYINHDSTWATATLDLAGGGEVDDEGQLVKAGDYTLYTQPWPADSTVAILDHWKNDLKYDMNRFKYWSMDNEMEIWSGTHSDLKLDVTGDFLVDRYVDVAKKARAAWPDVKLTGPVVANEWFWCTISYGDGSSGVIKKAASGEDRDYCWLEYFIKKVAEAEKASGKRLIDVLDIHWYPNEKSYKDQMNWHRVFFDTSYAYPGANGIKMVNGSWDNANNKEYIFGRINGWLDKYMGKDHGVTLGLTETSIGSSGDAMTTALVYASFIGTFADNGVELFTPWTWNEGMLEVVHLFSRYGHENRVASQSSDNELVSAYSSVSTVQDSMTVIIVNRSEAQSQNVVLDIANFALNDGTVNTLALAGLSGETFESHKVNALKKGSATVIANKVTLNVPAKSITAVLLANANGAAISKIAAKNVAKFYGNDGAWFVDNSRGSVQSVTLLNGLGQRVRLWNAPSQGQLRLATEGVAAGRYLIRVAEKSYVSNYTVDLK